MKRLNELIDFVKEFFSDVELDSRVCEHNEPMHEPYGNISPTFPSFEVIKNEEKKEISKDISSTLDYSNQESHLIVNQNPDGIVSIIKEFDEYLNRISDENVQEMIKLLQFRLMEYLVNNGAQFIDHDELFDNRKHSSVPIAVVPDGHIIEKTIRPGVVIENRVLIKAKVELMK